MTLNLGEEMTSKLTLEDAEKILTGSLQKARELSLNPMSVAVLDDGGHLKAFRRQDGPGAALHPKVAIGKANAAVGMGAVGVTGDLPDNDEAIAITNP
jgi:uncharacterized protein GlcG (DUF336 family)